MKYELVLFDLDGTLLDTSLGIFNSVRFAEKCMGFNPVKDELLSRFVGPPPKIMYQEIYGISEQEAAEATKYHRQYGATQAIYEARVYDHMVELLQILKQKDIKAGVATLKSQHIAEKVLEVSGIKSFFEIIVGMDDSESLTKADTIRMASMVTGANSNIVLVGDSFYDMEGASEAHIDFIGVKYGFGFSDRNSIPYGRFVKTVAELKEILCCN